MRVYLKIDEEKDKDIVEWLNKIDKEAISFTIKSFLREYALKKEVSSVIVDNHISKNTETISENKKVGDKLDKMGL